MKIPKISSDVLRIRYDIAVWRYGYIWLLLAAIGLALFALEALWQAKQQENLQTTKAELYQAQQQFIQLQKIKQTGIDLDKQRIGVESVENYTISQQEVGRVLRQIVELSSANNIVLAQSEFQTINEGHGGLRQIQMTVPIRANYKALRAYIEDMLQQLPMVSVDQVSIKREAITQGLTETRLKLSIWVDPQKSSAAPIATVLNLPLANLKP